MIADLLETVVHRGRLLYHYAASGGSRNTLWETHGTKTFFKIVNSFLTSLIGFILILTNAILDSLVVCVALCVVVSKSGMRTHRRSTATNRRQLG